MPTADQIRIAHDRARPRLMELWWALRPLTSVLRFMQTGAHPDDETTGMLAALAFRDGLNLSYACSTRGEGGQNDIGTETGFDLGALRTREMERACDVLGMRMYWHSTHPEDTITDFGFSKSGDETMGRWGRARVLLRFAEILRQERPDIICPTFLDVPGQHGHHRAMTQAAHAVMSAAADPDLPTDLPPWQVRKMYLPAWSGAGTSYDDDLPPPPATLVVPGMDREAMTGWTWNRIGQQSRTYHRTQGMGRWAPAGEGRDWPLHLVQSHVAGPDEAVWSGLPRTLGDLADLPGAGPVSAALREAQAGIDAALDAFPDFGTVARHAAAALTNLRAAQDACPPDLSGEIGHRLEDKALQLGHVLRLAHGMEARAWLGSAFLTPGAATPVQTDWDAGTAEAAHLSLDLPEGWALDDKRLVVSETAVQSDPYRAAYDPLRPASPGLKLDFTSHGVATSVTLPFEVEPVVLPTARLTLGPSAAVLNRRSTRRQVDLSLSEVAPDNAEVSLDLPEGWRAERRANGFTVTAPEMVAEGSYSIAARIDGAPAVTTRLISHDHVAPTARTRPAAVTVLVCDVALPEGKVGYVGAGNDQVGAWLSAMGADVTGLSDAALASDSALAGFDAIVIGIFAMRFRAGLAEAMPRLHRWTEAGGTLVTLYHRPWDNWDPDAIPPRRLEIGQPSLRWRVTDETAKVTHLAEHPILSGPNPIGPEDWEGWVKERGLYFAKSWDAAYTPLLSMSDPDEDPLTGALLVADIGAGRHIHSSLILHHQMAHLVPGAFRLMANFLARRDPR